MTYEASAAAAFFLGVAAFFGAAAFLVPVAFFAAPSGLAVVLVTRPDLVLPSTFLGAAAFFVAGALALSLVAVFFGAAAFLGALVVVDF